MQSGKLRQRITIEQATHAAPDAYGDRAKTWATWQTLWAEVRPVSGREAEFAKSFAATVTHRITTRWVAGMSPLMRVRWGVRVFAINAALNVGELGAQADIYATELLNEVLPSVLHYDPLTEADYNPMTEAAYNGMIE